MSLTLAHVIKGMQSTLYTHINILGEIDSTLLTKEGTHYQVTNKLISSWSVGSDMGLSILHYSLLTG